MCNLSVIISRRKEISKQSLKGEQDLSNNGEGKLRKKCPLLNDWCIGDACALSCELFRTVGGVRQGVSACSFNALVTMISEINAKTPLPQQKIQIPHILRG